jgi:glycosyltransferase involved in cell wall biosynthesis
VLESIFNEMGNFREPKDGNIFIICPNYNPLASKRVFFVTSYSFYGGVGTHLANFVSAFSGHTKVYSLIFDNKKSARQFYGEKVYGFRPPFLSGWEINTRFQRIAFHKFYSQLYSSLKDDDILHYFDEETTPVILRDPKIVTIHDIIPLKNEFKSVYRRPNFLIKNLGKFKSFNNIVTVSNHVKGDLEDYGFEGSIKVIYPVASDRFFKLDTKQELRKLWGLPTDKKIVLSVSGFAPNKNNEVIRQTALSLGSDYVLVRIGIDLGFGVYIKDVPPERINEIYNLSDVLLFPSLDEGFGIPMLEAMSAGLPVVATDSEISREVCNDAAIFVEPTVMGCINGVKEAIASSEVLSKKGIYRSKFFSFDYFKKQVNDLYDSIV